jgi:nucleotide-binding universal stress UspA family protein
VGETSQRASEPELRQLFERHQVRAEFVFREGDDGSAGHAMLEEVTRQAVDLVVMGLYGHPRWRETLIGGASRQMARHSPVALFVSH